MPRQGTQQKHLPSLQGALPQGVPPPAPKVARQRRQRVVVVGVPVLVYQALVQVVVW